MKKFFSCFIVIIQYLLIYFGSSILASILFSIYYSATISANQHNISLHDYIYKNPIPLTLLTSIIALVFFIMMIIAKYKNVTHYLCIKKIKFNNGAICILLALAVSFISLAGVNMLINYFPDYKKVSDTINSSFSSLMGIVSIIVLLPIFEEIFFRGIIFNELRTRINVIAALIIQALIFALFHGNIIQGIYTFILGLVLGIALLWTESIWSNIIIHISYNFFGTFFLPIIIYYTGSPLIFYLSFGTILTFFGIYLFYKNTDKPHIKSRHFNF
jgi:CAAX amino terminal protease family.